MLISRLCKVLSLLAIVLASGTSCRAATVLRTLTYHQITGPTDLFSSSPGYPVLSANGNRAAFTLPPQGSGDPAQPSRIFVINPDGTGFQQVDSYTALVYAGSFVDISDNGSKVVSSESVQIRIANGDGSGAIPLIVLESNEINDLCISGDGTKVFFRVYRDTSVLGSNPAIPIQRGIWTINANGTGLRQIVGPTQMAPVLGVPVADVPFFAAARNATLHTSYNGTRIVFGSFIQPASGGVGQGLFGVNLNGSGLHVILGRQNFLNHAGINSDGTKVGYTANLENSSVSETGAINFDGSGRLKLTDSTEKHFINYPGSRLQISADGSRLFLSDTGQLYNTDGSGGIALGLLGYGDTSDMVYDGLIAATMNSTATKFLYLFQPAGQTYQFARLDVNPASLGGAPNLSQPQVSPTFVVLNGAATATISTHASASPAVMQVGSRTLFNGAPDDNVTTSYRLSLVDNATRGDAVAGDGIFTNDTLASNCCGIVGAHTLRVKAAVVGADNKRHASAVDFSPFSVEATVPTSPTIAVNNPRSLNEGNVGSPGSVTFDITLNHAYGQTVTVNYKTTNGINNPATAGVDYIAKSGKLTFAPGETLKRVTVAFIGDSTVELNETFFFDLSTPTGATIFDSRGVGQLNNDDGPSLSIEDATTIDEGNSATKPQTFLVRLSAASVNTVTVAWATTDGTATSADGSDYAAASGTLSFAPGETSKTITIQVNGDTKAESNETYKVILRKPTYAVIADGTGVGTIRNDDATPQAFENEPSQ